MAPLVVIKIAFGAEGFAAALRADVRALLSVNHLVNLQIVLLAEGFPTPRESALEGLGPQVQMDMSLEAISSPKLLPTSLVRTTQFYFAFPDPLAANNLSGR